MTPDIVCSKTPWAPGWWSISAMTSRGRRWWKQEQFSEIGWNLGSGSFDQSEVEAVVRAIPDHLVIEVAGVVRKTEIVRLGAEGVAS